MKVPNRNQCFEIIRDMNMMNHIIDHSVMVCNVALCLAGHLKKTYPSIDLDLTTSSALLHDITKTRSFETGELHSETGGLLMEEMGYPEVGNIIRQHVILDALRLDRPISEQEIVNYSDKRVLHDQVVSLDRRLQYIKVKYGTNEKFKDKIRSMWKTTLDLEKKIFKQLSFEPSELRDRVILSIRKEQN